MIDFHMIYRKSGKSPYYMDARTSLSGQSLYQLQDVGTLSQSRVDAYKLGKNPYVSVCDDDDYVMNLNVVNTYLTNNPTIDALYTNSQILSNTQKTITPINAPDFKYSKEKLFSGDIMVHKLMIVKRELAIQASENVIKKMTADNNFQAFDYAFCFEVALISDWTYLNEMCYTWRMWNSNMQDHYKVIGRCKELLAYYKPLFPK